MANEENEAPKRRSGFWGAPIVPQPQDEAHAGPAWEPWQEVSDEEPQAAEPTGAVPQFLSGADLPPETPITPQVAHVADEGTSQESPREEAGPVQDFIPVAGPAAPPAPGRGYIEDAEILDESDLLPDARRYDPESDPFDAATDEVFPPMPEERAQGIKALARWPRKRVVAIAAAALLVLAYAIGTYYYSSHFAPRSRIGDRDVSGMTAAGAKSALQAQTDSYTCDVTAGDFSLSFATADIGLDRDEGRIAQDALRSQNAFAWPSLLFGDNDYAIEQGITFNEDALAHLVGSAVDAYNTQTIPTDSLSIVFDEEAGLYGFDGAVSGDAVDRQAVLTEATDAVHQLKTHADLDFGEATHQATVDDLPAYRDSVAWANASRSATIPLLTGGEEVLEVEPYQIAAWVSIGDGPAVVVDKESLEEWAGYWVAYEVYHRDEYTDYRLDTNKFVEEFSQRLATGVVEPYEVPLKSQRRQEAKSRDYAYERGGWDSELGRYIDIDLKAQFARFFDAKGEVIWESAFVSGSMIEAHSTVTGVFEVQSKQTGTVLIGPDYNGDGQPDYESYVNYWMPFYGGYGMHDATWRDEFGGDLYYYDGSHGCINLPYEKAEELFNIVSIGELVNVHW